MLPANDQAYLEERFPEFTVSADAGMIAVVIPSFPLPAGFTQDRADLMLRLSPGYPDVHPDMWWFEPFVLRSDGQSIQATEAREPHLGRTWQRWSRHFQSGQWRSGIDSLESYLSLVKGELKAAAQQLAA